VLTAVVMTVSVISGVALVFLVLLHAGNGGGMSDMMGGSIGAVAQGTAVAERNLDRITVGVAVVFAFTLLALALRLQ
jgi:preprotein translocase subunit SecG